MIFVTELVVNPIRIGTHVSRAANFPAATWAAIETAVAWTSATCYGSGWRVMPVCSASLILAPKDLDDVVAYILSLRAQK